MGEIPKRPFFLWALLAAILALGVWLFVGGEAPIENAPRDSSAQDSGEAKRDLLPKPPAQAPVVENSQEEPRPVSSPKVPEPAKLAASSLRGRVTLEGNFTPPACRVSFHYKLPETTPPQPRIIRQANTDESGYYEIADLVPGKGSVLVHAVSHPGPSLASGEIEILPGQSLSRDFQLRLGRARGTLLADAVSIVGRATLWIVESDEEDRKDRRGLRPDLRADEHGRFQTQWMPLGEWRLVVEGREGYGADRVFRLEVGENDLGEIRLEPGKYDPAKRPPQFRD